MPGTSSTHNGRGPEKVSRADIDKAIKSICRERQSQDKIIISVNEITAELETEFDIDVSPSTVRRKGVHQRGYYEKKYPEICSYNSYGDTRMRGLIVKTQKFLDEVES